VFYCRDPDVAGWQPETFAQKGERHFSEILNLKEFRIGLFSYFADCPQTGRDKCLLHFGRKLQACDRCVIRKFGRWIDHGQLLSFN